MRDGPAVRRLLDEAGPTMDIPTTAKVLGIHRVTAYELARRGELGVSVIKVGKRLRVPTAELRERLGLSTSRADEPRGVA